MLLVLPSASGGHGVQDPDPSSRRGVANSLGIDSAGERSHSGREFFPRWPHPMTKCRKKLTFQPVQKDSEGPFTLQNFLWGWTKWPPTCTTACTVPLTNPAFLTTSYRCGFQGHFTINHLFAKLCFKIYLLKHSVTDSGRGCCEPHYTGEKTDHESML